MSGVHTSLILLSLKILGCILPVPDSISLAKMLSLREVHIWYGDLKYWGVSAIKHI
jgi:hypothetical protein